ncbi:GM12027 [Drosophila sechellia]|uniref:GM12027 n=1 Tax=Drosophila sechellia TaxID=7238 RepID=B4IJ72_DROSE|nr:GM12027 [Drosophila sechellia]
MAKRNEKWATSATPISHNFSAAATMRSSNIFDNSSNILVDAFSLTLMAFRQQAFR